MDSVRVPLLAAALALLGALAAAAYVHVGATTALDTSLEERLEGIGVSLASSGSALDQRTLKDVMMATALEAAYVVSPDRRIVSSASGDAGGVVDLLRVDPNELVRAFGGSRSAKDTYRFGDAEVVTAYFPVQSASGQVDRVLVLEAGKAFTELRRRSLQALAGAFAVSLFGAFALALIAARWVKSERSRGEALARAARADVLRVVAAAAAHEIRNPLGVIRATIDLMRERQGDALAARDSAALTDIVEEVQRLRQLTDDLLDLAADKPLLKSNVPVTELLLELAAFARSRNEQLSVSTRSEVPELYADPLRLRQILRNLIGNAVDAKASRVELAVLPAKGGATVSITDDGSGVPEDIRGKLFDPFTTGKSTGTGLGLALSRRIAERHGGTLTYVPVVPGARFELFLPQKAEEA